MFVKLAHLLTYYLIFHTQTFIHSSVRILTFLVSSFLTYLLTYLLSHTLSHSLTHRGVA